MASAGGDRPPQRHVHRFTIPLPRVQPGQRFAIRVVPGQPGQGGGRPHVHFIPVPLRQQQAGAGQGAGLDGDIGQAVRDQEAATRRLAEEQHRKAQLRATLSTVQPPEATYSAEEDVVRVTWPPVEVPSPHSVSYSLRGWKDGAGEPSTHYEGQLTSCTLTPDSLSRGHTYQLAVLASAGGETGDPSSRCGVEVPALAPEQPLPPKIANRTKNALFLRWNAPSDNGAAVSLYSLEWDQCGGDFVELYSGKGKQFKLNHKFEPGSHAHFRVRARNAINWSEYSEEMEFRAGAAPPSPPHPPTLTHCTVHSLTLHWTPPPDSGAPVTSYCLEMDDPSTGYGFCPVYQGDGLSYTCQGLQKVTSYSFRLSATNEAGTSAYSSPLTLTTLPDSPGSPGAVCLQERPLPTSLHLAWSPPADDGGSSIHSYLLQVDDGLGSSLADVYKGPEVSFQLDVLTPGRSYRCRVCAISEGGQGKWSPVASFETPPTRPHPPSGLRVTGKVTQGSAVVQWDRPDFDGGSPVICYLLETRGGGGGGGGGGGEWSSSGTVADPLTFKSTSTPPPSSLTHTLSHLTPGTQYSARVGCRNKVGLSDWSSEVMFTTSPGTPSPPPQSAVTKVTSHSAQLQWMPSQEYGSPVTGYEVEYCVADRERLLLSTGTMCVCTLQNLLPATGYNFRVKAVCAVGHSDWSSTLTFSTSPSPPSPPSHLSLAASSPSHLCVVWTVPSSHGSALTSYHVQLASQSTSRLLSVPATETQATLDSLQPDTVYQIRVQAENEVGRGSFSSPLSAHTLPLPPPPPTITLISCTPHSLKLSWGKKSSKAVSYTLQLAADGSRFHTAYSGQAVSHRLTRLQPASQYTLRIAATSESGQGVWSDDITYETPPMVPPAPTELTLKQEDDVIVMSWGAVTSDLPITYEAQVKTSGQDFNQVYKGPSLSHTLPIATHAKLEARVRACVSCHVNEREELLLSAFSVTAQCVCVKETPEEGRSQREEDIKHSTSAEPREQGAWCSRRAVAVAVFLTLSVAVLLLAIVIGQLMVQ